MGLRKSLDTFPSKFVVDSSIPHHIGNISGSYSTTTYSQYHIEPHVSIDYIEPYLTTLTVNVNDRVSIRVISKKWKLNFL